MLVSALVLALLPFPAPVLEVSSPRAEASSALRSALVAASEPGLAPERQLFELSEGARRGIKFLGKTHSAGVLGAWVQEAAWRSLTSPDEASSWFAERLLRARDDLAFEPSMEADLPVEFPAPTPVMEIQLKRYPGYRMASAPAGGRFGAFWTLFRHIEERQIAMTAPVEMTFEPGQRGLRESRMAFLYGSPEIGEAGRQGNVEVLDVPPARVVSLGCRGRMDRARIEGARAELEAWLAREGAWEVAGPLRVMGYNSPMVPAARSYFEVQLPVRPTSRDV